MVSLDIPLLSNILEHGDKVLLPHYSIVTLWYVHDKFIVEHSGNVFYVSFEPRESHPADILDDGLPG